MSAEAKWSGAAHAGAGAIEPAYSSRQLEILDQAEQLLTERGMRAITLADITKVARCSRATLYEIARSKEELFLVVLERMLTRVHQAAAVAAGSSGDTAESILAFLEVNLAALVKFSPAFARDIDGYRPAAALVARHAARSEAELDRILRNGVAVGQLGDIDTALAAEVMSSAVRQVLTPESLLARGKPWAETVAAVIELMMYGLRGR